MRQIDTLLAAADYLPANRAKNPGKPAVGRGFPAKGSLYGEGLIQKMNVRR